jgi:tetratricopeptide (TPR) repeat protein
VHIRLPRLRALSTFTALGAIVAAGALIAITAMTASAAMPPNLGKAIEAQKRMAAERPQDAAIFNDLGNLLVLARQPEAAETAYRRAVELDPQRVSALFNLGLLLQQESNQREARLLYEKVVTLEPQHAWAHYQLGTLFEAKSDKSRAVREYAAAFALDPQLAFREVNPQIVDNRLVTESMLRAYQRQSAAAGAPAIYDDPSRIRDLLVPKPPKDPADANAAGQPGNQQHPPVLRPKDLPTGNLGQAMTPGGKAGAPPPPAATSRLAPIGAYTGSGPGNGSMAPYQGGRTWRPNPATAPSPASPDGTQPGVVVTPPPTGIYYQPGVSSTGRLGSQVMPEQNG